VGVDGVEGEIGGGRDFQKLCSGRFQLTAECFVLRLGGCEIGSVLEAEFAPMRGAFGLVPGRGAGRTNQDALQGAGHGMSVEERFGYGFWHGE
jgi:hypothetical protein